MSKKWDIVKPLIAKILQYVIYIAIFGFCFFVAVFWYQYIKETSWGFRYQPSWWIYSITFLILFPWEILWGFRKTRAYHNIYEKIIKTKDNLLSSKDITASALTEKGFQSRLKKIFIALIAFMFFAERYIVLEFSTTSKIRHIWKSIWLTLASRVHSLTSFQLPTANFRSTYETRGFIFYIVGLILLRQGVRYLFSPSIKNFELKILQNIDNLYSQPDKTKLISYSLLASIVVVFISFILNQSNYALVIEPPPYSRVAPNGTTFSMNEDPLVFKLFINNFDLVNSKISGTVAVTENDHTYKEGECEDIYTTQCDSWECFDTFLETICEEGTGFYPVFYNQKSIAINGKILPVVITSNSRIASATDLNFISQFSGDNYLFPFNKYTVKITATPENFWRYAKIEIRTNHRLLSITQDYSRNNLNGEEAFYFTLGYAPYYKILVSVILLALIFFLILIWQTKERETLIELSVGIFAAIITVRSFLIPQEFSTDPIFLDQVLLLYVLIFMLVLAYKHGTIKEQNRA